MGEIGSALLYYFLFAAHSHSQLASSHHSSDRKSRTSLRATNEQADTRCEKECVQCEGKPRMARESSRQLVQPVQQTHLTATTIARLLPPSRLVRVPPSHADDRQPALIEPDLSTLSAPPSPPSLRLNPPLPATNTHHLRLQRPSLRKPPRRARLRTCPSPSLIVQQSPPQRLLLLLPPHFRAPNTPDPLLLVLPHHNLCVWPTSSFTHLWIRKRVLRSAETVIVV